MTRPSTPAEEKDGGTAPFVKLHVLHLSCAWIVLGSLAGYFFFTLSNSLWHDPVAPWWARLGPLSGELLALAPWLLAYTLLTALLLFGQVKRNWSPVWIRPLVAFLLVGATLTYSASWMLYGSTGMFPNAVLVGLLIENPLQILRHVLQMEFESLLLLPIIACSAAALWAYILLGRPARFWSLAPRLAIGGMGVGAVLLLVTTWQWPFLAQEYERWGPAVNVGKNVEALFLEHRDPRHALPDPPVERHAQISLEQYLASADTSGLKRHNVIVLIVESLRSDQLLVYGGDREVMPGVEELARQSRVYLDHYSQASHSDYADLAPLSSHYPLRSPNYHFYPEDPPYPRVLIYDILKGLGYRVAVFSSQNENWSGMANYLQTGAIDRFLHADTYEGPTYVPQDDPGFASFVRGSRRAGKIDDRHTVREALDWIRRYETERPFFIYMNLQSSHVPYDLPSDFPPRFGSGEVSFPIRFGFFPPDSAASVKDLYANTLAYVDAQIAKLISGLRSLGLWSRTVLVLTGDTGQAFYEHGFSGHGGMLYEEVVRVPLLVRAPGLPPATDSLPAEHIDVAPTLLSLLGLPPHPSFQGRSLLDTLRQRARPRFLIGQALGQHSAVVLGGWKLMYDGESGLHRLFDLCRDPRETHDEAGRRPDVLAPLSRLLHGWRKTQLDYYQDVVAQQRWYPPTLSADWTARLAAEMVAPDC